ENLFIAATLSHLLLFDNQSYIEKKMSDALCKVTSGGAHNTREFYRQRSEVVLQARRPILLNSIEEIGTRDDLLHRSLLVQTERIGDEKRETATEFDARFQVALPRILGAAYTAVSAALRNLPRVQGEGRNPPRLADMALWVSAAEKKLDIKEHPD